MLIWSGWGILVPIIFVVMGVVAEVVAEALNISKDNWLITIAWILAGVIIWFVGKRLNNPAERIMIDKETGEEFRLNTANHRLFFIKMEYWGPIICVFAILAAFTD